MSALLPAPLGAFLATIGLAFIIGLELHAYRRRGSANLSPEALGFGTTRTVTLLAALGFALWIIAPIMPFAIGLGGLSLFLLLDYRKRIKSGDSSLLPTIIGVLAFTLGPLVLTAPLAVLAALVILILLALGEQAQIRRFSDAFPAEEGVTFAKFFILAGLIFPLLPDAKYPLSRRHHLRESLGGGAGHLRHLLSRLSGASLCFPAMPARCSPARWAGFIPPPPPPWCWPAPAHRATSPGFIPAAIVLATAMMYARLLVVIVRPRPCRCGPGPGAALRRAVRGLACRGRPPGLARTGPAPPPAMRRSPPTRSTCRSLSSSPFCSWCLPPPRISSPSISAPAGCMCSVSWSGFSDIDPFIFSLLDGKFQVGLGAIVSAVLIASASNNLLKAAYAMTLSRSRAILPAAAWLLTCGALAALRIGLTAPEPAQFPRPAVFLWNTASARLMLHPTTTAKAAT